MLSPEELSALYLSAKVACFATLFCIPFAIALAWCLARYEFRLKFLVEAILQLPMVLPPVVLGYLLLILFGNKGWIGQYLHQMGIELAFNWKVPDRPGGADQGHQDLHPRHAPGGQPDARRGRLDRRAGRRRQGLRRRVPRPGAQPGPGKPCPFPRLPEGRRADAEDRPDHPVVDQ